MAPARRAGSTSTRHVSATKRSVVIGAAPVVVVVMYPIFQATDALFGDAVDGYLGWGVGLVIYWVAWGVAFSWWTLGWGRIAALVRPRRPTLGVVLLVGVPLIFAGVGRVTATDAEYRGVPAAVTLLLVTTALGNGIFEEILWRGVYLEHFRDSLVLQILWPGLWFGIWHLAPGSVGSGSDGGVATLMIGAVFFGLYLAFVARHTDSAWWPIVAHVGAGLVMVL